MSRFLVRNQTKALILDGSTNYLELTGYAPDPTNMSVAFWCFIQDQTTNARLFDWQDAGPANGIVINWNSARRINAVIRNGASPTADLLSNTQGMARWIHIVVAFATDNVQLYVNGVLQQQDTLCTMAAAAVTPRIGARATGSTNFSRSYMDEFYLFNRRLTATEVDNLYRRNQPPTDSVDYYLSFNDTTADQSGDARTVTEAGSIAYTTFVRHSPRLTA